MSQLVSLPYGFTLFSNYYKVTAVATVVSLPYGFTLFSNKHSVHIIYDFVSLPYGFTLFSNLLFNLICWIRFHYLMDLHYSQTCFFLLWWLGLFHYLMDLHYSQTPGSICSPTCRFHYLMDLHYSQTRKFNQPLGFLFHYLMDLHYSQTIPSLFRLERGFHYLMDLHYSQTRTGGNSGYKSFTTLWIYTILKPFRFIRIAIISFTTLWIYTILKPQISCAHYTAQGKSTRSSTIVLWRNGIVKGTQIPIQHIEFGAHIYARRCLAL